MSLIAHLREKLGEESRVVKCDFAGYEVTFEVPAGADEIDEMYAEAKRFADVGKTSPDQKLKFDNLVAAFVMSRCVVNPDLKYKALEFVEIALEYGAAFNAAKVALWSKINSVAGAKAAAEVELAKNESGAMADGEPASDSPETSTTGTLTS